MGWLAEKIAEYSKMAGHGKPVHSAGALKLDSNENFAIPKQLQADILNAARKKTDIREYPLGHAERLAEAIAAHMDMPKSMIAVGNGSDQLLDLIFTHFASKSTKLVTTRPTFGFVTERCALHGIPVTAVPYTEQMTLDMDLLEEKSKDADILYLDVPNNPTGYMPPEEWLRRLVQDFEGMVILDEAYGEFSDYSVIPWARHHDNLVVIKTLSKSFGIAALRLGYLAASPSFVEVFNRVIQYPYPINSIAVEAFLASLDRLPQINDSIQVVKAERDRVTEALREHDAFEVFDSHANFVLFDARGSYQRLHTALLEQGILIRKLGKIGSREGCLRVTIGTHEMNSKFLLAIRDLLR
ncbi:histidinol-phosphate aminotransferase [Cenarchaeum symbiosum A]|uniref:histidinol-phosphate transaminase n=1 Tax=Cenarchaeum symbiosum (strain A) TaxID=414004 RepID=A0RZ73_CENSY|nr:histidinol-phosphate aminotransferase [Cenarchaeum symbiosum A]